MSGLVGLKQALKATNAMIGIQATNLTRTQVHGAKELRGSLVGRDMLDFGGKGTATGPGLSIEATSTDFSQGSVESTAFTTDMAIRGKGFFILMDATGKELFYTRQGNFHFDNAGDLVNADGLYVASFDADKGPKEITPSTTQLGRDILDAFKLHGPLKDTELQSILAPETLPNIQAELTSLAGQDYVSNDVVNGNTIWDRDLGGLERTTVEIDPIVSPLGQNILNEFKKYEKTRQPGDPDLKDTDIQALLAPETLPNIQAELSVLMGNDYVTSYTVGPDTFWNHNLGQVGDQVNFDKDGFVVNETRGLRKGNRIALATFPNPQGLTGTKFGGTIYKASTAAGLEKFGGPGDDDFGSLQTQTLERSNSSTSNSLADLSLLQRTFTSTTAAMKVFLSAADDLIAVFR